MIKGLNLYAKEFTSRLEKVILKPLSGEITFWWFKRAGVQHFCLGKFRNFRKKI